MQLTRRQVAEQLGISEYRVSQAILRGELRDASEAVEGRHTFRIEQRDVAEYKAKLRAQRTNGNGTDHGPTVPLPAAAANPLGALARIEDALARLARQSPPVTTDTDHLVGTLASMTLALNRIEAQLELLLAAWK